MFESCRAHSAFPEPEDGVPRNLHADVPESDDAASVAHGTRDATHDLALERELCVVRRNVVAFELEDAQRPVHAAAVVLARDRLLARVAALLEVDRPRLEAGLCGKDAVVDLASEARRTRTDPQHLELVVLDLVPVGRLLIEDLVRGDAEVGGRDTTGRR